jgi:hypothetical protein
MPYNPITGGGSTIVIPPPQTTPASGQLTSGQMSALAGTNGTPSAYNKFVTETDSRLSGGVMGNLDGGVPDSNYGGTEDIDAGGP